MSKRRVGAETAPSDLLQKFVVTFCWLTTSRLSRREKSHLRQYAASSDLSIICQRTFDLNVTPTILVAHQTRQRHLSVKLFHPGSSNFKDWCTAFISILGIW